MYKLAKSEAVLNSTEFTTLLSNNGMIEIVSTNTNNEKKKFLINWDGKNEDFWDSIDIGSKCYDVNVSIRSEVLKITLYPVIDGETITSISRTICSIEYKPKTPKAIEKKYYFIHIDEVNGEEEYSHKQVFEIGKEEEVKAWIATKILMPWYGNGLDGVMHGDGELICYHKNNLITISVEDYKEITQEDYLILSKYI